MLSHSYHKSYLKRLGLKKGSSKADIREAYRRRALRCHRSKESPERLKTFVELTVAFEFLKSYGDLGKTAFKTYEDQWTKSEKPFVEHKAKKQAQLSSKDFVRSEFYRELLEDSDDVAVFIAVLSITVAFGLSFGLYLWKGAAGGVIGGFMAFMILGSIMPYARGWRKFRFSRFLGHVDLIFNEPTVLSIVAIVVNALAIPFILFRFVIPIYMIPVVYLVAMLLFWLASRTILNHRTALFAKQFVLLGAPTFVSVFFLLNIPSFGPITEESYTFEPDVHKGVHDWGREYLENSTMIFLGNNAYKDEIGVRIFKDDKDFDNDTITYRMSKSIGGT